MPEQEDIVGGCTAVAWCIIRWGGYRGFEAKFSVLTRTAKLIFTAHSYCYATARWVKMQNEPPNRSTTI